MLEILDQITEWIKSFLIECITGNLNGLFDAINDEVGEIAVDIGQTPESWNSGVFSMIESISDNVIVPIAGLIITFIMGYELISIVIEKNNMHDFDTFNLYKWVFKVFVAVYLVTHTFDITMAIFDLAQNVVQESAGVITGNTNLDFNSILGNFNEELEQMGMGELFGLLIETMLLRSTAPIIRICIMLVLVGRMIEIYIYCSVGAIPLSTMANREWGQMGNNYLRGLVALGLQGFFMMICVAIYTVLISELGTMESIHMGVWICLGYTILLCYSLFKSSSVAKSVFNAS